MERPTALTSGHRSCQGCGAALGARYAVDAAMRAVNGRLAAANATGCLEVFSTPYPETSWQLPWFHSLFGNTAAVATGMAAAFKVKAKKSSGAEPSVIAKGGESGSRQHCGMPMTRSYSYLYFTFTFSVLTFPRGCPSIELPCTVITSRPSTELE